MAHARSSEETPLIDHDQLAQPFSEDYDVEALERGDEPQREALNTPSWVTRTFRRNRLFRARSFFGFGRKKSGNGLAADSSPTTSQGSTVVGTDSQAAASQGRKSLERDSTFGFVSRGDAPGSRSASIPSPTRFAESAENPGETLPTLKSRMSMNWSSLKGRLSTKTSNERGLNGKVPEDEWTLQGKNGSYSSLRANLRGWKSTLFSGQNHEENHGRPIPTAPLHVIQASMRGRPMLTDGADDDEDTADTNDQISPKTSFSGGPRPWAPPPGHPHFKWRLGFDGTMDSQTRVMDSPPSYKSLTVARRRFTDKRSSSDQGSRDIGKPTSASISQLVRSDKRTADQHHQPNATSAEDSHNAPGNEQKFRETGTYLTPSKKLYNGTVKIVTDQKVGLIHSGNLSYDATEDPLVPRLSVTKANDEEKRGRSPTPRPYGPGINQSPSPNASGEVNFSYLHLTDRTIEAENTVRRDTAALPAASEGEEPPQKRAKIYKSTESRNASPCPSLDAIQELNPPCADNRSAVDNKETDKMPEVPVAETASVLGKRRIAKESLDLLLREKENNRSSSDTAASGKPSRSSRRWSTKSSSHDSSRIETDFVATPHGFQAFKHTAMRLVPHSVGSRRWRSRTGSSWSYDSTGTGAEAVVSHRRPWRISRDRDRHSMISDTSIDEDVDFVVDEELEKRANDYIRKLQGAESL